MNKFNWKPTVNGYQASTINDKYLLDVWQVDSLPGGWFAGVNREMVQTGDGKDEVFYELARAKAAAEQLADEMMRRDGVIDE